MSRYLTGVQYVREGQEYHDNCPKCGDQIIICHPTDPCDKAKCFKCGSQLIVRFKWAEGGAEFQTEAIP